MWPGYSDVPGPKPFLGLYHLLNIGERILAAFYITQRIITKLRAVQCRDGVAKRRERAADLAVTPLAHMDFIYSVSLLHDE